MFVGVRGGEVGVEKYGLFHYRAVLMGFGAFFFFVGHDACVR